MEASPSYIIEFYLGDEMIFNGDEVQLKEKCPSWDMKLGIADTVIVDNIERKIMEMEVSHPNLSNEKTRLVIRLK